MITIYQNMPKLIKNFLLISALLPMIAWANPKFEMSNPESIKITLRLALTRDEQAKGLSGVRPKNFSSSEGMLFVNDSMSSRGFWMPDTFFNLDIIFMDQDLKIVGLEKNVPFHPTKIEPPVIYRTKRYQAQFVLETKANSSFSKNLKIGDTLKWLGPISLSEIVLKTRQKQ